jgi:hypothetical protein
MQKFYGVLIASSFALASLATLGCSSDMGNRSDDELLNASSALTKTVNHRAPSPPRSGSFGPYRASAGTFRVVMTGKAMLIYVRKGVPSTSAYDCRPYKTGSSETCTLTLTERRMFISVFAATHRNRLFS